MFSFLQSFQIAFIHYAKRYRWLPCVCICVNIGYVKRQTTDDERRTTTMKSMPNVYNGCRRTDGGFNAKTSYDTYRNIICTKTIRQQQQQQSTKQIRPSSAVFHTCRNDCMQRRPNLTLTQWELIETARWIYRAFAFTLMYISLTSTLTFLDTRTLKLTHSLTHTHTYGHSRACKPKEARQNTHVTVSNAFIFLSIECGSYTNAYHNSYRNNCLTVRTMNTLLLSSI